MTDDGKGFIEMGKLLPDYTTPEELAAHLQVSERTLRETARSLGACSVMGKRMILLPSHVDMLMEATRPCPSSSSSAERSGITEAPFPEGGYEGLLKLRTKQGRNGSPPKGKRGPGKVISMDPRRH
ncbi:hypothetical protein [Sinorhizobium fredii]|uniref:hypothetical protein n=1 Tax=Rhizobium fredii TaxID=380 RepID=UPI001F20BE2B|nr:hypothetical protein [Sinorhizobium fredii]